jgi:multisubunit Na+/H+ antiporter MnhG subunit
MRNKRGDGYITTCVMVVIICMLIAVFVTFTTAVSVVRMTERNSKIVLDSYVMKNSILIYIVSVEKYLSFPQKCATI